MVDKVRVLYWGNLMDRFYNYLSVFFVDSIFYYSSDVGNIKEMVRFLFF